MMTSMAFWTYISSMLSHWMGRGETRGGTVSGRNGSARDEVTAMDEI